MSRRRSPLGLTANRGRCVRGKNGSHDEPLWRRADEIERIAGDQRQRPDRGGIENRDILRVDNPRPFDPIDLVDANRFELDDITGTDVFQAAEVPVTMSGNARVAVRTRPRRLIDVTEAAI